MVNTIGSAVSAETFTSIDKMTDEQLAILYIEGNNRAFDLLLERNKTKIFTYILFVVRNRELANDVFQDTFVKVIVRLQRGDYQPTGKFSAWVMRIAHNVVMDLYRATSNSNVVDVDEDNDMTKVEGEDLIDEPIETAFINEQVLTDVKHLMEMLPPLQREVVFMRFFQNLSFKEISETTGVSINTALGRMRYAIINMRRLMNQHQMDIAM